ncbi:MAG: hypothetical protein PHF65_06775 [Oscillospiraceae bacterium]|jgi:hypothetical protein|nr:hypothetical protein [Oscillospiraceae bacterium]
MDDNNKVQNQYRNDLIRALRKINCEKIISQFDDIVVEQKDVDFISAIQTSNIVAAQNTVLEYIKGIKSVMYYEKAERLAREVLSEAKKAQRKAEIAQWITIAVAVISIVINVLITLGQK